MGASRHLPTIVLSSADRGKLGPCMQALTDRQRKFVYAMLDTGQVNHTACARVAGYQGDEDTMKVTAHRLAHDEKIQAAIQEEARKMMGAAQLVATAHLVLIATNPAHKDQLSAIKELMNRSGLAAATEHKITVTHAVDRVGVLREIEALAKDSGMDPRKLLSSYGVVVDADFTEIAPDASAEGLEDVL